jgi:uncharacterized protein
MYRKGVVGMPVIEAYVDTTRAARYVEQLSKHFAHRPGGMRLLENGPGQLLIDLGTATWRIEAQQNQLVLRLEAADAERLDEASKRVAERIEQLGRRDGLRVRWRPGGGVPNDRR